jgi:hypothetical protein
MKSLSLLALLALSAFGAIGPSFEVPVLAPVVGRAVGIQDSPRVATDGRDFFAVWMDSRGGRASVYGTRILADGTVLDPTGILIAAPGAECKSPALVWDGSNYVVVWLEQSSRPYSLRASYARIDRDGMIVGAPKALPDNGSGDPLIASNGHGSMVIFSLSGTVARIDQNGTVTPKPSVASVRDLQIASNGSGYLLSWNGATQSLLRLDDNGDAVASSAQQLPNEFYSKLSAGIGGPYLLSALKFGSDGSACAPSIEGRFVTSKGLSDPFVIYDAGGSDILDFVVTPDRNGFQFVWLKRLGPNPCGPALDGDPPSFHGPYPPFGMAQIHLGVDAKTGVPVTVTEAGELYEAPSVASTGAAEVVVWVDSATTFEPAINAAIVHPGIPAAPIPIASSAAIEMYSCIAASENTFMTAWVEGDPFSIPSTLYARRFDINGRALDAAPIKVSADNQTRNYNPVVLFDGAVWLFLWGGTPGGSARRMAADGSWIDAAPFVVAPLDRSSDFAAASNGNGFALFTFSAGPQLAATFIPRTGEMRRVPIPIAFSAYTYPTPPSMAWDGNAYVVVWRDGYDDFIEGVRLDQNGQVVTPLFIVDKTTRLDDRPSIDCHQGKCAVAWQSNDSIAAALIAGGTVVPIKTMIDSAAPNTYAETPTVLATRDGFQLFWSERGSATPLLFTASISAAGIGARELIGASGAFSPVGAAVTTHGQLGLIILRAANDPVSGGAMRAFLRVWSTERRRAVGR